MGRFIIGDVVAVPFPFSNLSGSKLRPAVVLAEAEFGDLILCQITSNPYSSKNAILITKLDFSEGSLPIRSYVRPDKLFTAESTIIQKSKGKLKLKVRHKILKSVQALFATG
jgi:mRNA interferase MazF